MVETQRVALVTGGSRGIGRAVCLRLAREGARIALNYRRDEESAAAVRTEITEAGGDCTLVQGDVSDPTAVSRMFETGY